MIIYLPYIHAISKKYKKSVSVLVKDNSRAKDLLAEDNHINEIITLKKEMDGISGIFRLSKELKKTLDTQEVKDRILRHFSEIFESEMISWFHRSKGCCLLRQPPSPRLYLYHYWPFQLQIYHRLESPVQLNHYCKTNILFVRKYLRYWNRACCWGRRFLGAYNLQRVGWREYLWCWACFRKG